VPMHGLRAEQLLPLQPGGVAVAPLPAGSLPPEQVLRCVVGKIFKS